MTNDATGAGTKRPARPHLAGSIPQFVTGQTYRRRQDIHLNYGGGWQSGISPSDACPAIFLFTGDSGEKYGYRDDFDTENVFSYTGEGQTGNMEFKRGNRAIRDHASEGRALHLFRAAGKGSATYLGEFVAANYSLRRAPDRNARMREVIVFHLLRVDAGQEAPTLRTGEPLGSLDMARRRAYEACSGASGLAGAQAVRTVYERSRAIRDYVLYRAQGVCEQCGLAAPFQGRDGQPYLEAHHTTRLSDGGVDHPRYVAALCPACHREMHYGIHGAELNELLSSRLQSKEETMARRKPV